MLELALDPRDQENHPGPEWVKFDLAALDDLPFSVSGEWDRELVAATGHGIVHLLRYALPRGQASGKTALMWLARKMADIDTVPFEEFDIRWRRIRDRDLEADAKAKAAKARSSRASRAAKAQAGDADPPPSGSSEPASE